MANAYLEIAETPKMLLAQTGDVTIFTVTGRVVIHSIVGKVTTALQNAANASLIKINPTVGADVDLCAALDIDNVAAGAALNVTGTVGDAMIAETSGVMKVQATPFVCSAGVIELECAASNTGNVKWIARWEPLDAGSTLTPQ